mmetsp:Transcript_23893/g.40887  ORF Transcript_23893/g.40887 Transcript_23893/m.40887 type:complete len:241 (+) Transcript_23893:391-1113(+)
MSLPIHQLLAERQYERRAPQVPHLLQHLGAPLTKFHGVFPHRIVLRVRIHRTSVHRAGDALFHAPILSVAQPQRALLVDHDARAAEEDGEGRLAPPRGDQRGEFVGGLHDGFDALGFLGGSFEILHEELEYGGSFLGLLWLLPDFVFFLVVVPLALQGAIAQRLEKGRVPQQTPGLLVFHERQGLLLPQSVDRSRFESACRLAPFRTIGHTIHQMIMSGTQQRQSLVVHSLVVLIIVFLL